MKPEYVNADKASETKELTLAKEPNLIVDPIELVTRYFAALDSDNPISANMYCVDSANISLNVFTSTDTSEYQTWKLTKDEFADRVLRPARGQPLRHEFFGMESIAKGCAPCEYALVIAKGMCLLEHGICMLAARILVIVDPCAPERADKNIGLGEGDDPSPSRGNKRITDVHYTISSPSHPFVLSLLSK